MYLLDTDVLSNLLKRTPSTTLIVKLASVPQEQRFTSSITLGELVYGAYRLGARAGDLLERLERTLLPNLPVLPFDAAAARRYGEVRAELERQGTPVGDADLRIGAIALARGLTVVTGNVRHFQRIPGLAVEDWLDQRGQVARRREELPTATRGGAAAQCRAGGSRPTRGLRTLGRWSLRPGR